jgi:hypothetical protein
MPETTHVSPAVQSVPNHLENVVTRSDTEDFLRFESIEIVTYR